MFARSFQVWTRASFTWSTSGVKLWNNRSCTYLYQILKSHGLRVGVRGRSNLRSLQLLAGLGALYKKIPLNRITVTFYVDIRLIHRIAQRTLLIISLLRACVKLYFQHNNKVLQLQTGSADFGRKILRRLKNLFFLRLRRISRPARSPLKS